MTTKGDKAMGCWMILMGVLALSWLGFMGWVLYTTTEWLVHQ